MKKYLINILYGFLAWLIPFVASFFFYTREGELTINILFFKSIMIVVGSFSAAFLLVSYFKKINADYFTQIEVMYLAIPAMSIAVGTALENKK
ncbi:MAG: hypothetical protein C3F06_03275 [Candidatus Methanoperedenaceae archaeon]|nr:MAG: hypothetical protein C3F06_03275 [Candidatus Methanoperedenaceae archaeon]